ncbi:Gfo/Idh/MocA family oxidoreductase [Thermostilla marina]
MDRSSTRAHGITRRRFAAAGAAVGLGLSAASYARAAGANDRVRLAFIGVGNRGSQLLDAFLTHDDAEPVVFCDVYEPYLDRARERVGRPVDTTIDFRHVLDRNDVDAVVIATPDHWHALMTVWACRAGKDVYVEKPLSVTVVEGRKMVEAAREHGRVVQVGTHRRSSTLYHRAAELIGSGGIGKVTVSRAYRLSNMFPDGIGKAPPSDPPSGLHWDLWLGPRPARPFQATIAPYKFRWWHLYSSQMANWGVHYLDAIRWLTGEEAPSAVCAMGGRFAVDDDRTIPDTLEVTFEFASGRLAVFGQYEASGNPALASGEIELRGTQGTAYIDERRLNVVPEKGGQFQTGGLRMDPIEWAEESGGNAGLTAAHARNFLDCIKSRRTPNADVEIGHRSTTFALIANIALATKSRLEWDPKLERFTNHADANRLLHYEYRKPWRLD